VQVTTSFFSRDERFFRGQREVAIDIVEGDPR
jgi:hypothetical protein